MLIADPADAVVGLTRQLVAFGSVNPGLVPGAAGAGPVARFVADRVPAVVRGPAGGGLPAVDEWVDLAQRRRYPVAVAAAVGPFLAG